MRCSMESSDNLKLLQEAGLLRSGYEFSAEDLQLLRSLSEEEVKALISVKRKVGEDFLNRNTCLAYPPVGIVF
jgi:hypothetical protein